MPRLSKAEQRRREQEADEARIRAALRWTDPAPPPDVLPPEQVGDRFLSTGYTFNAYANRIDVACSGPVSHAVGRTDTTTTQGGKRLYATRLLALRALRNAVERACAERLAAIDARIEQEGG